MINQKDNTNSNSTVQSNENPKSLRDAGSGIKVKDFIELNPTLVLANVKSVIRDAGKILLHHFGKIKERDIEVKSKNDYVTFVDKESESFIMTHLKKLYPKISFLAEESGSSADVSKYRWIIDPLDGTKNYIHSYPLFCISISLEYRGKPVISVVYDPLHREMFSAISGMGAYLNGEKISVSNAHHLQQTLIVTGFPFRNQAFIDNYLAIFRDVFMHCSSIRRDGSAALDLCYTACGRFDGFWEFGLNRWDISGGALVVQESGGRLFDIDGSDNYLDSGNIVCANPVIIGKLKNILINDIHCKLLVRQ